MKETCLPLRYETFFSSKTKLNNLTNFHLSATQQLYRKAHKRAFEQGIGPLVCEIELGPRDGSSSKDAIIWSISQPDTTYPIGKTRIDRQLLQVNDADPEYALGQDRIQAKYTLQAVSLGGRVACKFDPHFHLWQLKRYDPSVHGEIHPREWLSKAFEAQYASASTTSTDPRGFNFNF